VAARVLQPSVLWPKNKASRESGVQGWISCVAQSGRPLVRVATPAPQAPVQTAHAVGRVEDFKPDPEEVLPDVSDIPAQRSTGSRATVAESPPAASPSAPMSGSWLRRQKAQQLGDEADKMYVVDNRFLQAGTDGIGYRFSKDLDDIDPSYTALWNTIVEGHEAGDGWLKVADELYLPMMLGGVPVLTPEDSPFPLSGLQSWEAFPVGCAVVLSDAAVLRSSEDARSEMVAHLEQGRRLCVEEHGVGTRSRRLKVSDPASGLQGWLSFASQTGKLLVNMVGQDAAELATSARPAAPAEAEEAAFYVDNREYKADSQGIGYRRSKDLDDKEPTRTALWDSVIVGKDCRDGWIRVGSLYLPEKLGGVRVVTTEVPAAKKPEVPGFMKGSWEYICVDPDGFVTKAHPQTNPSTPSIFTQAIAAGEMLRICERGVLNHHVWLCLDDGRGWVIEKSSRRHFSEVNDDPQLVKGTQLIVDPWLEKPAKMLPAPLTFKAVTGGPELLAGTRVEIRRKVMVLLPPVSGKGAESWTCFYKVVDDKKKEGWMPEMRYHAGLEAARGHESQKLLQDFKAGFTEAFRGKSCWLSCTHRDGAPLLVAPGTSRQSSRRLKAGDLVEAVEQIEAAELIFFRLSDGSWICNRDERGKVMCELVEREKHRWVYVCNDKDGAQVREAPTRHTNKNTSKRLKHRERAIVTEKVTFPDGDVFLKLEQKKGWVPATKLKGAVKMAPLKELEPEAPKGPVSGMGPPGIRGPCRQSMAFPVYQTPSAPLPPPPLVLHGHGGYANGYATPSVASPCASYMSCLSPRPGLGSTVQTGVSYTAYVPAVSPQTVQPLGTVTMHGVDNRLSMGQQLDPWTLEPRGSMASPAPVMVTPPFISSMGRMY